MYPLNDLLLIVTSIIYIDGIQISRDSQLYNNSRSGGTIASGYLVLDGSFFLKIPAGNHTYSIVVSIYGGSYSRLNLSNDFTSEAEIVSNFDSSHMLKFSYLGNSIITDLSYTQSNSII